MTDKLTPTETLAAIAAHRASAAVRRDELLAERRGLTSAVLNGGPAASAKVKRISEELRSIDEMEEDLLLTERRAKDAIAAEEGSDREKQKVVIVHAVKDVLEMRNVLAEGIDAKVDDLLADLRKFDAMSFDTRSAACSYGRPETISFLSPRPAMEILFSRLVAMESLPDLAVNGQVAPRETIADISRTAGGRLLFHLAELLPPEKRPADTRPVPAQAPVATAPAGEDEENFVDDLPALEEV